LYVIYDPGGNNDTRYVVTIILKSARVKLDEDLVDSTLAELDAGGPTSVSFTVSSSEVGSHTVSVEGMTAGLYVQPRDYLWLVVVGGLLVGVGAWYLIRRRKGYDEADP